MRTYTIWIEFLGGEQKLTIRAASMTQEGDQRVFRDEDGGLVAEVPEAIIHDVTERVPTEDTENTEGN